MPDEPPEAARTARRRTTVRLAAVLLGLTALVLLLFGAFALPSVHGGPHGVPLGVTGPPAATGPLERQLGTGQWDTVRYDGVKALTDAVRHHHVTGGLALGGGGVGVYTATAGAPSASGAITALGQGLAVRQHIPATVHDLVPYPHDDPHGAGLAASGLPLVFGGVLPAVLLTRLFPGHSGLVTRLVGVVLFSLMGGAAITAFLHYGTGSITGSYWLDGLGISLGVGALSVTFIGLEALTGFAGLTAGGAVMMFLGNPLSALNVGPHWLPPGWSTLGQILPPGASGSLLRANAFFDGAGAAGPAEVLAAWVALGLALVLAADRRGRRRQAGGPRPSPSGARRGGLRALS